MYGSACVNGTEACLAACLPSYAAVCLPTCLATYPAGESRVYLLVPSCVHVIVGL